jgi:hypothetical protein
MSDLTDAAYQFLTVHRKRKRTELESNTMRLRIQADNDTGALVSRVEAFLVDYKCDNQQPAKLLRIVKLHEELGLSFSRAASLKKRIENQQYLVDGPLSEDDPEGLLELEALLEGTVLVVACESDVGCAVELLSPLMQELANPQSAMSLSTGMYLTSCLVGVKIPYIFTMGGYKYRDVITQEEDDDDYFLAGKAVDVQWHCCEAGTADIPVGSSPHSKLFFNDVKTVQLVRNDSVIASYRAAIESAKPNTDKAEYGSVSDGDGVTGDDFALCESVAFKLQAFQR